MATMTEDKRIAATILQQLGGNRFIMMTGAKNFVTAVRNENKGMGFKIPRSNGITHVTITLNGFDLYDMEFVRVHGMNLTVVAEVNDVYYDQLQAIFTEKTGLYTSL